MKYKRVLYTDGLMKNIKDKLRIIKYDKIKSEKKNVYFVYFSSEENAEFACKACKKMQNVTMKVFQPKPSLSTTTTTTPPKQTASSVTMTNKITSITATPKTIQPKAKLITRQLAPNSSEIQQICEKINVCINAMNTVKHTFDEIIELDQEKHQNDQALFHRFYSEHSSASYLKMALAIQLKALFSSGLRVIPCMVANQLNEIERHVHYEQNFVKTFQLKQLNLFKSINFQSSITMTSKLAYELAKLTET